MKTLLHKSHDNGRVGGGIVAKKCSDCLILLALSVCFFASFVPVAVSQQQQPQLQQLQQQLQLQLQQRQRQQPPQRPQGPPPVPRKVVQLRLNNNNNVGVNLNNNNINNNLNGNNFPRNSAVANDGYRFSSNASTSGLGGRPTQIDQLVRMSNYTILTQPSL